MSKKPLNPLEQTLRDALKPVRVTYNPGLGAFENYETWREPFSGEYQWPAQRDPIFTPLFTAIFGAGGFGLTGGALSTAVTISTAIATTAVTPGIQARR
jgi:hypothetical protein